MAFRLNADKRENEASFGTTHQLGVICPLWRYGHNTILARGPDKPGGKNLQSIDVDSCV